MKEFAMKAALTLGATLLGAVATGWYQAPPSEPSNVVKNICVSLENDPFTWTRELEKDINDGVSVILYKNDSKMKITLGRRWASVYTSTQNPDVRGAISSYNHNYGPWQKVTTLGWNDSYHINNACNKTIKALETRDLAR